MNIKKILSGPIVWIVVGLAILGIAFMALSGPSVHRVDTSTGLELLKDGKVEQALLVDGDQRVQLTLTEN